MQVSYIIIIVLSGLISVMIGVVLWFASRNKKLVDNQENRLIAVSKNLEDSQNRLDRAVIQIVANTNANLEICKERHSSLNLTMLDYSRRMDENKQKIHEIEVSLAKINGKK